MPGGPLPGPRSGEMTRLSAPATAAEGGPGTARAPGPAKAGHSPRTQAPWGRPQGRRVSIPQRLETDQKQTGSLGVTAGFLFPQRQRRFPGKGSRSGNAAEGLPFLPPRWRQGRRRRPVGYSPGGSGRRAEPRPKAEPPPEKAGYPAPSAPALAPRRTGGAQRRGRPGGRPTHDRKRGLQ